MLTNNKADFDLESEEGVGTFIRITMPTEVLGHA
jgi:sensor histidine kinase YesM